jgi:hypothetical protein
LNGLELDLGDQVIDIPSGFFKGTLDLQNAKVFNTTIDTSGVFVAIAPGTDA